MIKTDAQQVWKHIFLGPRFALGKGNESGGKKGQALINGLEKATAGTIAYAAMQVSNT